MIALLLFSLQLAAEPHALFNGRDLTGWHISEVNHHGNTKAWSVKDGVLLVTQDKPGNGGILLTDKSYRNFELTLEVNPDYGCDGGIFLRSTEKGEAYQVMLDYLEGGAMGGIYGERLPEVNAAGPRASRINDDWAKFWKKDQWNQFRIRMTGVVPRIQVWLNGQRLIDFVDTANHAVGGAEAGMIALQTHRTDPSKGPGRWKAGGYHRYRNIRIEELP
jgi:hypothetical protein